MKNSKLRFYMLLSLPLYFTNAYADTAIKLDVTNNSDFSRFLNLKMIDADTNQEIPLKTDLNTCKDYNTTHECEIPTDAKNFIVPFTNTQTFDPAVKQVTFHISTRLGHWVGDITCARKDGNTKFPIEGVTSVRLMVNISPPSKNYDKSSCSILYRD